MFCFLSRPSQKTTGGFPAIPRYFLKFTHSLLEGVLILEYLFTKSVLQNDYFSAIINEKAFCRLGDIYNAERQYDHFIPR
jgi:hypothetical protein